MRETGPVKRYWRSKPAIIESTAEGGAMLYRVLVTVILAVHFAYLGYTVLGGFLAWRWPRAFWPHLAAAAWGLAVVGMPLTCPLTVAENWARVRGGGRAAAKGFIDRYVEGVLYPERYTRLLQVLVGVVIAVSWLGALRLYRNRHKRWPDTGAKNEDSSDRAATV
jgi:hypothetical protein